MDTHTSPQAAVQETLRALHDAVLSAFPTASTLSRALRYEMNWNLDAIAPSQSSMDDVVFALLRHAESRGQLRALYDALRRANPANPDVIALDPWIAHPRPHETPDESARNPAAMLRSLPRCEVGAARDDIRLVLATYNPQEAPTDDVTFRVYEGTASRDAWPARFGDDLVALRTALSERPDTRHLSVWLACTPAVCMRAGVVFHESTGMHITRAHATSPGALGGAVAGVAPAAAFELAVDVSPPHAGELHVLLSITRDVTPHYEAWARDATVTRGAVLRIAPSAGPSATAIGSMADALRCADDIGACIKRQLGATPRDAATPTRIFFAGPAVLAFLVGRTLNATGPLSLMDLDRSPERYVESFCFVA